MGNQGYIYSNSLIHKLNPALKFIGFILMIVLIFLPLGYFGQLIVGIMVMVGFLISKLSGKTLLNILKSVLILFILLLVINWAVYKEPIAVYLNPDANVLGSINPNLMLTGPDYPNGFYISELWGGSKPIIFDLHNQDLIDKIITQNAVTPKELDSAWKNLNTDAQTTLTQLFQGNLLAAKQYNWLMSQSMWSLDNVTYHVNPINGISYNSANPFGFVYYHQEWYTLSPRAINLALYVSIKVFLMIVLATLLTATTSAIELTNGLQAIFSPLRIFKLPVNEMSMMIAIALRFVPSLLIESKRILNAQASRGVDFHNGGMMTKMKALTSLVVPLFSIAFKNADDLANAMEARGYNPRKTRTKFRLLTIQWYDWVAFCFLAFVIGLFIGLMHTNFIFGPFGLFELEILNG